MQWTACRSISLIQTPFNYPVVAVPVVHTYGKSHLRLVLAVITDVSRIASTRCLLPACPPTRDTVQNQDISES